MVVRLVVEQGRTVLASLQHPVVIQVRHVKRTGPPLAFSRRSSSCQQNSSERPTEHKVDATSRARIGLESLACELWSVDLHCFHERIFHVPFQSSLLETVGELLGRTANPADQQSDFCHLHADRAAAQPALSHRALQLASAQPSILRGRYRLHCRTRAGPHAGLSSDRLNDQAAVSGGLVAVRTALPLRPSRRLLLCVSAGGSHCSRAVVLPGVSRPRTTGVTTGNAIGASTT